MDRMEYLTRAQIALWKLANHAHPEFAASELVLCDGIRYIPVGRLETFDGRGNLIVSAVLRDLHANSERRELMRNVRPADAQELTGDRTSGDDGVRHISSHDGSNGSSAAYTAVTYGGAAN